MRSENLVAVSNGGQVVTSLNLERISSLADSDKTGVLVGNKGIGFKAVYQVTDAPEIYSAAEASDPAGQYNVFDDLGVGIALERHPFEDGSLLAAIDEDVRTFFAENHGLARALAECGIEDGTEAVRQELSRVAGFKFPLPRDACALARHVEALKVPVEHRARVRTLVVLPLRD